MGRLPLQAVGAVVLIAALLGSRVIPVKLPESGWRIPQTWEKFGRTVYAAVFGGILGAGVFTAIPSAGFYALLAWSLAATDWTVVVATFGTFGAVRAFTLVVAAISAKRTGRYPDKELDQLDKSARFALAVEVTLLATVGALLLVGGAL